MGPSTGRPTSAPGAADGRAPAKCYLSSSSQQHQLQRRRLRLREAEQLAQGHTAKESLNQDLSLILKFMLWSLECSQAALALRCAYSPTDSPPT